MKRFILAVLVVLSSGAWAGSHGQQESVAVKDAYVRHMPPTQTVTGAFMMLVNPTDSDRAAVSAESSVAGSVELHTHIHDSGVMRMRQVEKIDVPARGMTELKPGGFHIMLIDLKAPLESGQMVDIKLNFDDGSSVEIDAEVKSVMGGMKMDGMKMDGSMDHEKMDHSKMKTMEN